MWFLQNCLRVPGYTKISTFGYPVPEITKNAALVNRRCNNPCVVAIIIMVRCPNHLRTVLIHGRWAVGRYFCRAAN